MMVWQVMPADCESEQDQCVVCLTETEFLSLIDCLTVKRPSGPRPS